MKNLRIITPRSCNYDLAFIHHQTEDLHASLSQAKSPSIVEVIDIRGVSLFAVALSRGVDMNQPTPGRLQKVFV
ncbi:hypothetical protein [Paraburkholderia youngii]|uniref:hypothetical protein n=1 Tax=Paraburkholderia youngii TaxID=2782701 RepID=UPI003D1F7B0D